MRRHPHEWVDPRRSADHWSRQHYTHQTRLAKRSWTKTNTEGHGHGPIPDPSPSFLPGNRTDVCQGYGRHRPESDTPLRVPWWFSSRYGGRNGKLGRLSRWRPSWHERMRTWSVIIGAPEPLLPNPHDRVRGSLRLADQRGLVRRKLCGLRRYLLSHS